MADEKSNVPWPVWALVSIAVAFIPAYYSYKANIEKKEYSPNPTQPIPADTSRKTNTDKQNHPIYDHKDDDELITDKLIGTWNISSADNNTMYKTTVTYAPDRTFNAKTDIDNRSQYFFNTLYYSGIWEINNSYNIRTVTYSSNQQFLKDGKIDTIEIISITRNRMVYFINGKKRTAIRQY